MYYPSWFGSSVFIFIIVFCSTSVYSSPLSYSAHCSSIVPESTPSFLDDSPPPFIQTSANYYSGGETLFKNTSSDHNNDYSSSLNSKRSLNFRTTRNVYRTASVGVYKIEAYLIFQPANFYYVSGNFSYYNHSYRRRDDPRFGRLRFRLNGFWSETSRMLCMVGSAAWYSKEGKAINLHGVLKLNYAKNSTIFTSLVNGTLESLSSSSEPNFFDTISILAFPSTRSYYQSSLFSKVFDKGCSVEIDVPPKSSLSLQQEELCSIISSRFDTFELDYAFKCNPSTNCSPFSADIHFLPRYLSLYAIHCSYDKPGFQYLLEFRNTSYLGRFDQPFDPITTLVGEGSWDSKRNRLCIVACRILYPADSLSSAHVGDCSIRLSLRFPAVWSVRNSRSVVGHIWTNKTANALGFFDRIKFESHDTSMIKGPGLKYEYTVLDRLEASCSTGKPVRGKKKTFPIRNSYDMRFDMSLQASKEKMAWGFATPLFVDEQPYDRYFHASMGSLQEESALDVVSEGVSVASVMEANASYHGRSNISYGFSFTLLSGVKRFDGDSWLNLSSNSDGRVDITAEGIYNDETGQLCLVGCRRLNSYGQKLANDSLDCEIVLNFQFSAIGDTEGGLIQGSMKSTRKSIDILHFEVLNISANSFYAFEIEQSRWRMDSEIALALISNTLTCLFVVIQIFHVKRHSDVLPFISLLMLVILTMGQMVPLVMNFEALFKENHNSQNLKHDNGGLVEANEVIVRAVTLVAFLLQSRLLQMSWSSRYGDETHKPLCVAEKKAMFVSVPLYVIGLLLTFLVNWWKNSYGNGKILSVWTDLRSYGGLLLDGFLLPQILLNIFINSRQNALSCFFYFGTTLVRLVPHGYDLYRAHNYVIRPQFNESFIYANPRADFYSTAWDIIIPFGGIVFAVIVYLQQRLGGVCVLPRRFRELQMYEKVPVANNDG